MLRLCRGSYREREAEIVSRPDGRLDRAGGQALMHLAARVPPPTKQQLNRQQLQDLKRCLAARAATSAGNQAGMRAERGAK